MNLEIDEFREIIDGEWPSGAIQGRKPNEDEMRRALQVLLTRQCIYSSTPGLGRQPSGALDGLRRNRATSPLRLTAKDAKGWLSPNRLDGSWRLCGKRRRLRPIRSTRHAGRRRA